MSTLPALEAVDLLWKQSREAGSEPVRLRFGQRAYTCFLLACHHCDVDLTATAEGHPCYFGMSCIMDPSLEADDILLQSIRKEAAFRAKRSTRWKAAIAQAVTISEKSGVICLGALLALAVLKFIDFVLAL